MEIERAEWVIYLFIFYHNFCKINIEKETKVCVWMIGKRKNKMGRKAKESIRINPAHPLVGCP